MLVLDVGSGTDKFDIARGNICLDLCRSPKNKPKNFVCGDAHHIPFKDNTFDKVTMYEVIEHVESPIQCLKETNRVLRQGGAIELSTPNIFHWRILLRQFRNLPQILSDTGHIACWSEAEIKNILSNASFSSSKPKYITLPLVYSPHRTLDMIMRSILPASISETNLIIQAVKP